jgi:hypothetical protein
MFPIEYRKPHDVSFDKDKSMMRCQITRGAGEDARDGSDVVVHFSVHAPNEDGTETLVFDSASKSRSGIRFTLGETLHAEVIERAILGMPPGSVVDVICTDADAACDNELRISPPSLGSKATDKIITLQRKEFSEKIGSSIMPDRNKEYAEEAQNWKPPATMTRWNVPPNACLSPLHMAFPLAPPHSRPHPPTPSHCPAGAESPSLQPFKPSSSPSLSIPQPPVLQALNPLSFKRLLVGGGPSNSYCPYNPLTPNPLCLPTLFARQASLLPDPMSFKPLAAQPFLLGGTYGWTRCGVALSPPTSRGPRSGWIGPRGRRTLALSCSRRDTSLAQDGGAIIG